MLTMQLCERVCCYFKVIILIDDQLLCLFKSDLYVKAYQWGSLFLSMKGQLFVFGTTII